MSYPKGNILIVEDNIDNQILLKRRLLKQGHTVQCVNDGEEALTILEMESFDIILMDVMMPKMGGFELLEALKNDPKRRQIPIVMLSALNNKENVIRGIELGAEDYMFKPFQPALLKARIDALLAKMKWREQEKAYTKALQNEKEKSERLLLNILPEPIAERLKQGEEIIADYHPEVTILFADLVEFTNFARELPARELVHTLNHIFSEFDYLAKQHHLEKVKTIGDGYMVVGGMSQPNPDHATAMIKLGIAMQNALEKCRQLLEAPLQMRIGIHTGPVVAGVIGSHKFSYDVWGNTVNIASRLQENSPVNAILVSEATYKLTQINYSFRKTAITVKGNGETTAYIVKNSTTSHKKSSAVIKHSL